MVCWLNMDEPVFPLLLSALAWILASTSYSSETVAAATRSETEVIIDDDSNASPCSLPLNRLIQTITEDIFPIGYEVFINCLSFDEQGALNRGDVSGYHSSENRTMRFVIECASEGSILVALQSEMAASMFDIRQQEYTACVECEDSIDPCRTCKLAR